MRLFLLLILAAAGLRADALSFGIRGGVPLTRAFDSVAGTNFGYNSAPVRYTVGPSLEVRLPMQLSVVFDVLYKRLNYNYYEKLVIAPPPGETGAFANFREVTANQFEFPILLKYRFAPGLASPYVAGGPYFNRIGQVAQTVCCGNPIEYAKNWAPGFSLAGGLEIKGPIVRVTPEIRYTHRTTENFKSPAGNFLGSQLNQLEFLLGVHF